MTAVLPNLDEIDVTRALSDEQIVEAFEAAENAAQHQTDPLMRGFHLRLARALVRTWLDRQRVLRGLELDLASGDHETGGIVTDVDADLAEGVAELRRAVREEAARAADDGMSAP